MDTSESAVLADDNRCCQSCHRANRECVVEHYGRACKRCQSTKKRCSLAIRRTKRLTTKDVEEKGEVEMLQPVWREDTIVVAVTSGLDAAFQPVMNVLREFQEINKS